MLFLLFAGTVTEAPVWPPIEQATYTPFTVTQGSNGSFTFAPTDAPAAFDIAQQTKTGLTFTQDATPNAWSLS